MTGMKDGAAADPFQDPPEDQADPKEQDQSDSAGDEPVDASLDPETGSDSAPLSGTAEAAESTSRASATSGETATDADIPYIFRRERTLQGRDQKPLYLQPETQDRLDAFVADLNDRYDRDVKKADVQEAAIIAAIEGETINTVLERWGYGR